VRGLDGLSSPRLQRLSSAFKLVYRRWWHRDGVPAEESALRGHHPPRLEVSHAWTKPAYPPSAGRGRDCIGDCGRAGARSKSERGCGESEWFLQLPSAQVVSCKFANSFADGDFCGSGQTVDESFEGRFNIPRAPTAESSWNDSTSDGMLTSPHGRDGSDPFGLPIHRDGDLR
jgi:hypothetical protein